MYLLWLPSMPGLHLQRCQCQGDLPGKIQAWQKGQGSSDIGQKLNNFLGDDTIAHTVSLPCCADGRVRINKDANRLNKLLQKAQFSAWSIGGALRTESTPNPWDAGLLRAHSGPDRDPTCNFREQRFPLLLWIIPRTFYLRESYYVATVMSKD